jgi:hypothetical protein
MPARALNCRNYSVVGRSLSNEAMLKNCLVSLENNRAMDQVGGRLGVSTIRNWYKRL